MSALRHGAESFASVLGRISSVRSPTQTIPTNCWNLMASASTSKGRGLFASAKRLSACKCSGVSTHARPCWSERSSPTRSVSYSLQVMTRASRLCIDRLKRGGTQRVDVGQAHLELRALPVRCIGLSEERRYGVAHHERRPQ